jgi:RNA polymerase sigma factor (sigma-70 family)
VLTYLHPLVFRQLGFLFGLDRHTEDAAQEALIAILEALPSFAFRARLTTWAMKIAFREGRRHRARERREQPAAELPEATHEPDLESRLDAQRLLGALDQLTEKKRQAFVLMELLELTAEEAGRVLGTFANTAASRCRHAKEELRALLTNLPSSRHQEQPTEPVKPLLRKGVLSG